VNYAPRRRLLGVVVAALAVAVTVIGLGAVVDSWGVGSVKPTPREAASTIAAAGDIACDPADPKFNKAEGTGRTCRMRAVSDLLVGKDYAAVLALGDTQYGTRGMADFRMSYDPSWGRVKAITRPIPGDEDYANDGGAAYLDYFGAAAGRRGQTWYSFEVGSWHLIALDSSCSRVGGCRAGSRQERWLKQDLAAHRNRCVLAFWHYPLFGSNRIKVDKTTLAFWKDLYKAGAELVLSGNNHWYERFAPQDPAGRRDPEPGIRQFIVGTGGASHHPVSAPAPNSEVRDSSTFGVLELTLRSEGYDWQFLSEQGGVRDSGSATCH